MSLVGTKRLLLTKRLFYAILLYHYSPFKNKDFLQDTDLEGLRTAGFTDFIGYLLNIFNLN